MTTSVDYQTKRTKETARQRLGEVLIAAGVLDEERLARALAVQERQGGRLGSILIDLELCTEAELRRALADQFGVNVVSIQELHIEPDIPELLPLDLIRKYEVIPLGREGDHLWIAMLDPYNLVAIDDIRFATGCSQITISTCSEPDFKSYMSERLATQNLIQEILQGDEFYDRVVESLDEDRDFVAEESSPENVHELKMAVDQKPIVSLCNFVMVQAMRKRASDIHVEPSETESRVRIRVDGRLQTLVTPPRQLHAPIVSRYKVMADMDITKRRVAQDGHLAVILHGRKVHFRVSTMPTVFGEKCVLRIMHQNDKFSSLGGVGMSEDEIQRTRKAFASPQGLILVTGPTGSGKTTTLHAGLAEINDPELNIITLEDPVEATVRGVNHVQVNEKRFTFANALRAVLRQDPDIVFVGEMRDEEVASIAVRAALTGHLVLSTLHTNGAAESLIRLDDLGVPRYLISNCLRIVIAQRLLRRVCPACAEETRPTLAQVKHLGLTEQDIAQACYREGRGCDECAQTGYSGRLAVYEMLEVDETTKRLIHQGASVEDIMTYASSRGMRVLLENGLEVAARGDTTLSEIVRVFQKIEGPCGEPKPVQC